MFKTGIHTWQLGRPHPRFLTFQLLEYLSRKQFARLSYPIYLGNKSSSKYNRLEGECWKTDEKRHCLKRNGRRWGGFPDPQRKKSQPEICAWQAIGSDGFALIPLLRFLALAIKQPCVLWGCRAMQSGCIWMAPIVAKRKTN